MKETSRNIYKQDIVNLLSDFKEMSQNKKNYSKVMEKPENISKKAKRILKDMYKNHDNSWGIELFLKNIDRLDKQVLFYRGKKIDGYEFWGNVYKFCKSIKSLGIEQGEQVPVMISNSPEFIYFVTAAVICGVVPNIVGTWFDKNYLVDIFNKTKAKYAFVSDDINENIEYAIEKSDNIKNVVMFSLTDSLPRDSKNNICNPYAEIDDKFGHFKNNIHEYKEKLSKNIIVKDEFLESGINYNSNVVADTTLDSPAVVTYTSGTTKPGYPKGCLHSNANYFTLATFKEYGNPTIKNFVSLAHLPSYTQTGFTCIYTDSLSMGWPIAIEPYFELEFYPYSLMINEPCLTVATPEYEKYVAKKLDTEWKNVDMPSRVCICICGQALSPGLEKYINRISREHKFGISRLPFPLAPVTVSIGGGTTENGGIFYTLFKGLQEKNFKYMLRKKHMNLSSEKFVDVEVFNENGEVCKPYERGICYVITPTNQIGYINPEFNKGTKLVKNGRVWTTTGTPCYKDEYGKIRMLDRPNTDIILNNGDRVPLYSILDLVQVDTKNIMDSFLVKVEEDGQTKYVIHIEKQPDSKQSDIKVAESVIGRLNNRVPKEILDNLYFRFRSFELGFPVNGTGKTDMPTLVNEGLNHDMCIPFNKDKEKTKVLKRAQ